MPKGQPLVSADVKQQILERVKKGDIPISEIASEHGIRPRNIYGWLSKGATSQPTWVEVNRLKRENQALKELIGKVTYEMSMAQKKN
jgi:transposase-like protein